MVLNELCGPPVGWSWPALGQTVSVYTTIQTHGQGHVQLQLTAMESWETTLMQPPSCSYFRRSAWLKLFHLPLLLFCTLQPKNINKNKITQPIFTAALDTGNATPQWGVENLEGGYLRRWSMGVPFPAFSACEPCPPIAPPDRNPAFNKEVPEPVWMGMRRQITQLLPWNGLSFL